MHTPLPRWTDTRLLERLKALWSEAFGDSEPYISLVFERVYSQSLTRWSGVSAGGAMPDNTDDTRQPVAMLFATPFQFGDSSSVSRLTGIYLSGLATDVGYRRRGIMSGLLNDFIAECKGGVPCISPAGNPSSVSIPDFLFLIPADSHLRGYYEHFGFESSGERSVVHLEISATPDDSGECRVIPLDDMCPGDREMLYSRISQYEKRGVEEGCLQIRHSREAIDTAIAESAQNMGRVVTCAEITGEEDTDVFLWADKTADGWTCRVWHASSVCQLLSMANMLCGVERIDDEGATRMRLRLYGAPWQTDILREMHENGICSELKTEPYAMILKLGEQVGDAPLSIELMLD